MRESGDDHGRSAHEIASRHRRGESVVATALATLERIERLEPELHCFAHLDQDAVLLGARELDAVPPELRGPLHGVPVGVKDIIDTEDAPTTYGSPIYAGHRPARDAVVVARLRAAGALMLGKTVTTEFALFTPGPTRNPHDRERTPGGSSSGSAAAVAAGLLPLALATQTAGSTIRPASFCGVLGAKPTFGRVPFAGVRHCAEHLDTLGIIAHDAADAGLALSIMAADQAMDPTMWGEGPVRIGWWPGPDLALIEPEARSVLQDAVAALGRMSDIGLTPITLPEWFPELIDAQQALMRDEVWHALEIERTLHPGQLSAGLLGYLGAGPDVEGARRALELADRGRAALVEACSGLDAILTPSVIGEAPARATTGDPVLCRIWTLLGAPAIAVPGLRGPTALPLGVQLVGPPGKDAGVLRAADRLAPLLRGIAEGSPV